MSNEPEDPRLINKVALFWRELLGEDDYQNYHPSDLYRWFHALERRGALAIRSTLDERIGRYPLMTLHGVVPEAPHPPTRLVQLWLDTHEKQMNKWPVYPVAAAITLLCLLVFSNLYGCMTLNTQPKLVMHPPVHPPIVASPSLNTPNMVPANPGGSVNVPQGGGGSGLILSPRPRQPRAPRPNTGQSVPGGGAAPQQPNGALIPRSSGPP